MSQWNGTATKMGISQGKMLSITYSRAVVVQETLEKQTCRCPRRSIYLFFDSETREVEPLSGYEDKSQHVFQANRFERCNLQAVLSAPDGITSVKATKLAMRMHYTENSWKEWKRKHPPQSLAFRDTFSTFPFVNPWFFYSSRNFSPSVK